MIAERQHAVPDDLPGLVALAGDQERIALAKAGDRGPDRFAAVADLPAALGGGQDRRADRRRIFAAGIVVGDNDMVGMLSGDRAHQRTLAGIAVAAGAKLHNEAAFGVRPQRLQGLRQRIRLVRVVDEDRRAIMLANPLEPALGALEMFERGEDIIRLAAGADRKTCGDKRVLDLEFADQRQAKGMTPSAMLK